MTIRKKVSVFCLAVLIFLAGIYAARNMAVGDQTQTQNLEESETVLSKDAAQSLYADKTDAAPASGYQTELTERTLTEPTERTLSEPTKIAQTESTERTPTFSLYCIGSEFKAESGDGISACDVRNKPNSTHDIRMRWYITEDEMASHNLSTEGLETMDDSGERRWTIAETGLFEPGYHITSVQLLELPDGTCLPAGSYNLILAENYYDHITGEEFPYISTIPITLTIG